MPRSYRKLPFVRVQRTVKPGKSAYIKLYNHGIGARGVQVDNDTLYPVTVTVECDGDNRDE